MIVKLGLMALEDDRDKSEQDNILLSQSVLPFGYRSAAVPTIPLRYALSTKSPVRAQNGPPSCTNLSPEELRVL